MAFLRRRRPSVRFRILFVEERETRRKSFCRALPTANLYECRGVMPRERKKSSVSGPDNGEDGSGMLLKKGNNPSFFAWRFSASFGKTRSKAAFASAAAFRFASIIRAASPDRISSDTISASNDPAFIFRRRRPFSSLARKDGGKAA